MRDFEHLGNVGPRKAAVCLAVAVHAVLDRAVEVGHDRVDGEVIIGCLQQAGIGCVVHSRLQNTGGENKETSDAGQGRITLPQQAAQQRHHAFALAMTGQFERGLPVERGQWGMQNPFKNGGAVRLDLQGQIRDTTYDSLTHDQNP
jgi:hypothetical protein